MERDLTQGSIETTGRATDLAIDGGSGGTSEIPADAMEHIFEPFWQANDPTTRSKGGVGLGLSIVQWLVQLMNGQIRVESTVGVGSTILVTLPIEDSAQGE